MRPRKDQLREQIAYANAVHQAHATARREATDKMELTAVCLVGPDKPMPRFAGDNRGGWPVRVVITKRERTAARAADSQSPYHKFIVLESVNVDGRKRAARLKLALDGCLLGHQQQQGNDTHKPRHQFRDVMGCWEDRDTRSLWWGALLQAATQECGVDVFDSEGREKRIRNKSRGKLPAASRPRRRT